MMNTEGRKFMNQVYDKINLVTSMRQNRLSIREIRTMKGRSMLLPTELIRRKNKAKIIWERIIKRSLERVKETNNKSMRNRMRQRADNRNIVFNRQYQI